MKSMIIGKVANVVGTVMAIDPQGNVRILKPGDPVFMNEIIQTSVQGRASIDLNDGNLMTIARNDKVFLNEDVISPASALDSGTEGQIQDVKALQQAIDKYKKNIKTIFI
jgi:hypothetical protein